MMQAVEQRVFNKRPLFASGDMPDHISEHLLAYVENRLDVQRRVLVETHLQECRSCRMEEAAMRDLIGAVAEAGRMAQHMPVSIVHTMKGWAAVRRRLQTPLAARVRHASHRLSWQVSFSLALTAMAVVSGVSLTAVQASTPNVPSIETPGTHVTNDTPTLSVTRSGGASQTPTLTLTPIPIVTN